jgi:hypothetical protein
MNLFVLEVFLYQKIRKLSRFKENVEDFDKNSLVLRVT